MKFDPKYFMAFTGAGISAPSGVPTFADTPGIREKLTRRYANKYPDEFKKVIDEMHASYADKEPNDAHLALAEYNVPIFTMNVDGLHRKAGSTNVVELHGVYPEYVLYDDDAPEYAKLYDTIEGWPFGKGTILIIGTSFYTSVSEWVKETKITLGHDVIVINDDAETVVRQTLERLYGPNR